MSSRFLSGTLSTTQTLKPPCIRGDVWSCKEMRFVDLSPPINFWQSRQIYCKLCVDYNIFLSPKSKIWSWLNPFQTPQNMSFVSLKPTREKGDSGFWHLLLRCKILWVSNKRILDLTFKILSWAHLFVRMHSWEVGKVIHIVKSWLQSRF